MGKRFYLMVNAQTSVVLVVTQHQYLDKFIHWAIKERLNNHCNNKGLLGMK